MTSTSYTARTKLQTQLDRGIVGHEDDNEALTRILNESYSEFMSDIEVTEFKRLAERWYFSVMPKPEWMTWDELYLITQN